MRPIKFKAWNDIQKKMFDAFDMYEMVKGHLDYDEQEMDNSKGFPVGTIFLEFTGREDKNGKEICEGDIIFNKGIIVGEVRLGEYKCRDQSNHDRQLHHIGWYVHVFGDGERIFEHDESLEYLFYNLQDNYSVQKKEGENYTEVRGNIYENPELIKRDVKGGKVAP